MRLVKSVFLALFIASFFSVSYAVTPDRIRGAMASGETVKLIGNVHHKALPQYDQGPVDPAMRMGTITLLTAPTASQQKALQQLLAQQQDPKSPNYRKWLTPQQYADRFGLSQNDMQQMASWLKSQGFTLINVARGRNWISFNGTAAQVQNAFATEIHRYNVNGELHYANATAPSIPAAMSGVVTGIRGLHDFRPRPRSIRRNSVARPYYNSSTWGDLVAPGDISTIYDIKALYNAGIDGTGQKLAVMGQTDIYLADITDFRTGFGLSAISCTANPSGVITACNDPHFQYVLDGADPGLSTNGDISEADLDVEWSGATAKGAQIIYVNSSDTFTSFYYAIDNQDTLGETVISLSYGLCEFEDNFVLNSTGQPLADELELMKANAEGITFLNSSGDSGAAECDPDTPYDPSTDPNGASAQGGLAVSYPASSPEVTGVGGTALSLANVTSSQYWGTSTGSDGGSALSYIPELPWNDDAEFVDFCQQNPGTFCTQGGSTKVSGWVPIINAQDVQIDFSLQGGQGISSAGGGVSNCAEQTADNSACVSGFGQPSWQTVTISGQTPARFSPDVSLLATPNFPGYIFCTQLSELGDSGTGSACAPGGATGIQNALSGTLNAPAIIGGTSVSTPVFAGIVALLNQKLSPTGLGNINPTLYSLALSPSNGAFHPITTGDNLVYCTAGTPSIQSATIQCPSTGVFGFQASSADSTTSYNLVTGLGSVDANNLASAWAAATPSSLILTPTAASFQVDPGGSANSLVNVDFASGFTGTVTFTCTDTVTGSTCTAPSQISAAGQVSFNITTTAGGTPEGNYTITLTGTSGAVTASTTINLAVTGTGSFTLAPNPASYVVSQGASINATVNVTFNSGFIGTVSFRCADPAPASTCTLPPQINAAGQVSFNITTTAPTVGSLRHSNRGTRIFYAALLPGLFGIMFTFGSRRRSLHGMRFLGLIVVLGFSTLLLVSCGGSSNTTATGGTTKGTYTITVTGTSGTSTASTTFQLVVQ